MTVYATGPRLFVSLNTLQSVYFSCFAVVCCLIFKINFFQNILSGTLSEFELFGSSPRPDLGSNYLQVYGQAIKFATSKERVNGLND